MCATMESNAKYNDPDLTRIITILDRAPACELNVVISPDDWIKIYNYLKDLQLYHHMCGLLKDC